jgi:AraC-like DNA-binding protein
MKPVMVLRQVLTLLFMLSVLLASALSLWMARKRSLPLFDLVCRLNAGQYPETEKPEESGTGYKSLEIGISSMLQRNVHMQEQLETIHPMLLPAFLHRLFGGGFADDREVADAAGQIGVTVPLPPYRLISFIVAPPADRIPDLHEGVLQTLVMESAVRDCLEQLAIKDGLAYQMRMDEILWIYSGSEYPSDEVEMLVLLDRIVDWMGERQFRISIRFSPSFDTLADCWWEYERINHTMSDISHGDAQRSNIELVWHDPDPDRQQYMLLVEPILSSMYRAGDERMLSRLLDIVKKEIFETLQLDPSSIRILIRQLRDASLKLTGVPLELSASDDNEPGLAFDAIRETILYACRDSVLSRNESGSFLIRKIREFTDQQLYNPLLSMTMIADKMNISENYLSRVFKDHYGDTLANYIEKSRIQFSQDLLLQTMMSVSDIALKVGYNSDHVFRRAFRRVTGMSPIEFRQGTNSAPGD